MANYFLNDDGTISTNNKSKGRSYILRDDGTIYENKVEQANQPQQKKNKSKSFFAPLSDGFQLSDLGELGKNLGKSIVNAGVNIGEGYLKSNEGIADTATFVLGHGYNNIRSRLGIIDQDEYRKNRDAIDAQIGRNMTKEVMDKVGLNQKTKDYLNDGSFIKTDSANKLVKTASNTAVDIAKGTAKTVEGWYDAALDLDSKINDGAAHKLGIISDEEYNARRENVRKKISKNITEESMENLGWDEQMWNQFEDGSLVKRDNFGGQIAESIGGMVPSLLIGQYAGLDSNAIKNSYTSLKGLSTSQKIIAGGTNVAKAMLYNLPSNVSMAGKVYGNSLEEAYANGATDSEATKYAIMQSSLEIASEWITGGIPGLEGQTGLLDKGAEFLIDKSTGKIKNEFVKGMIKTLANAGYEMAGEAIEEGFTEILTPIIKNATYSEGEKINWADVINSMIIGGITGGILNLPGTVSDVSNVVSNTINNENNVNTTENETNTKPPIKLASVKELNSALHSRRNKKNNVSNVKLNSNKTNSTSLQELASTNELTDSLKSSQTIASNTNLDTSTVVNEQNNINTQEQLNDQNTGENEGNTNNIQNDKYEYKKSDNTKIDNLRKSAAENLINSSETTQLINTIEKVIEDKDYNVVFDSKITNDKGISVNAQIKTLDNGEVEIRLNPNSDRAGEFLLVHEITHSISNDDLRSFVNDYASKNKDFANAIKSLEETYGTTDISDEVLADISGQLFGNQEFINSLQISNTVQSKNIIKRVYESLKRLLNKLTEGGRYRNFVQDLEAKWREAYRMQSNNLQIETKYSSNLKLKNSNGIEYNKNGELDKYKSSTLFNQMMQRSKPGVKKKLGVNDYNNYYEILKNEDNDYEIIFKIPILGNEDFINKISKEWDENVESRKSDNTNIEEIEFRQGVSDSDNASIEGEQTWTEFIDEVLARFESQRFNSNKYIRQSNGNSANELNTSKGLEKTSSFSSDENNNKQKLSNISQKAKDYFGITNDFKKAGYIIENGEMLDFSEDNIRREHSDISAISDMEAFINNGAIRIIERAETSLCEIAKKPTADQIYKIMDFSDAVSGKPLTIDLKNGKDSITIKYEKINSTKVKNDILNFYNKGTRPNGVEILEDSNRIENLSLQQQQEKLINSWISNGLIDDINDPEINKFIKGYPKVFPNGKIINLKNSLTDKTWQQHLEENYKSSGTRTVLKDIKSTKKATLPYIANKSKTTTDEEKSYYEYVKDKVNSLKNDLENSQNKKITDNLKSIFDMGYSVQDVKATLNNIENNIINKPKNISKLEEIFRNKFNLDYEKYTQEYETRGMSKNQKKIFENEYTISNLEEQQQNVIKRIDDKISQKQNLYDQLKNKDTKKASELLQQIEMLKNQQANRKIEYEDRINRINEKNKNLNEKDNPTEFKRQEQRALKQDEYRELAFKMTENMVDWKDKSRGISYEINTMKRNLYDIMSNEEATKMYETYFRPITDNNAKMEKYVNSYNEKINKLNLSQKEAVAVQMLGEYKYNKETLVTGTQVDEFMTKNKLDYKKVEKAVEVFRNIYDEVIVETNKILAEQGMKTIEYRKGYFPHFVDEKPVTRFGKIAEKLGFKINDDKLPTDIAGITDMFKPGKAWFRNAQQRKGKYTDFNAFKGYDNYIRGAAEIIFHTEDIQKLRALESVIRYQYTDSSFTEELDKIYKDNSLDADEKQRQVDELKAKIVNPLGNFATIIKDYTDSLANKKAIGDRSLEHSLGREIYSTMTNIQSRVSANMVGLNISSALTNFIPITQAYSQISTKNMAKAIRETISSQHKTDNLSNASTFLTNRNNQAERLYKTKLDTLNQKASLLFESIDDFTSNVIVRGKYYENVEKGMSDTEALRNADEFAKDIMAGRDKGSMPTIMNRKNPLMKLFTAFQLEVNNQYGYMLKDLPRDLKDEGLNKLIGAFAKMFLGAWLYNKFSESVTGRKSAFSPIDIVGDAVNTVQNENMSGYDKFTTIMEDVAGEVPFIGGLVGGGRLPISSALPDFANTTEALFNLSDKDKRNNSLKTLKSELMKPVFYVVMPFGGGQIKKTIEGASMYSHDLKGSYTSSGKLRFEADKSPLGIAQSLVFGQYASKNAREYFDNGYAPLTKDQQEEIKELGISVSEYREYRKAYSDLNKIKSDKTSNGDSIPGSASGKKAYSIINNENYSKDQKNYLLNAISSESGITIDDLNNLENDEEIFKYFYSLNTEKKKDFLDEIKNNNFTSRQLYDYNVYKKQMEDKYVNTIAKQQVVNYIQNSNLTSDQKLHLYFKNYGSEEQSYIIKNFNIDSTSFLNTINYVNNIKDEFSGSSYSDYRKNKIFNYINSLNLSIPEKIVLFKLSGYSLSNYKDSMFKYINEMNISKVEKEQLWNYLY